MAQNDPISLQHLQMADPQLYISTRLPSHEQWEAAAQQGATHIHARVVHDEYERIAIESALIQSYQPPLNRARG